uniref:Uncharacterized protein n=1 Tax=Rhizophora mucronata TaxID=61149 RepID=A0A2P2QM08_RHIMU
MQTCNRGPFKIYEKLWYMIIQMKFSSPIKKKEKRGPQDPANAVQGVGNIKPQEILRENKQLRSK